VVDFAQKLVAMATSLERSKNNFRLFIYSHSCTNLANSVKICPVDVQISDPAESSKIKYKTAASHARKVSAYSATMKVNGRMGNLTPATQKPLNRWSPKFV